MALHIGHYDTEHPGDTSDLKRKLEQFDPEKIDRIALLTKTEGNADKNDYSRQYALLSVNILLKEFGGESLLDRSSLLFSTGTEGAYTPFGYYFIRTRDNQKETDKGSSKPQLVMGINRSRRLKEEEVGTMAHVNLVSECVKAAMKDAGITQKEVAFCIVKNPVMAIHSAADGIKTQNRRVSASHSKGIGGIGAGIALGEIDPEKITVDKISKDHSIYAKRAMVFSGAEVDYVDVILFGNKAGSNSGLVAYSGQVKDLLDGKSIKKVLLDAGCKLDEYGDVTDPDQVVAFFLKIGIAPDGYIRGARTNIRNMHVDMDFPIRATATGLVHSILGTTRTFISADTVHQSIPGGGLCGCIVKVR